MPNALAREASPYLRQHAENPVHWMPWGEAAFERARREDKPVFLSIGYATCHWCHVMAHESFEDEAAAAALNDTFVCVKVDREERPDVDALYMAACLALNGHGGWPLTALLTPDREPFFVGTYLPTESRGGRIGVIDLAERVGRFWREDRDNLTASAEEIAGHVREIVAGEGASTEELGEETLDRGLEGLRRRYDEAHGGFGAQPKFPTPHNLLFLLREHHRTGDAGALEQVVTTLHRMARGGLRDHLGGGFHRYSTDRTWLLPHFEKMLYDQAMLTMAYAEAHQVTGDEMLGRVAAETADYVLRDLIAPDGPFFSAEDADSEMPDGHMEEGAFYVWTERELRDVLGDEDALVARAAFGTTPEGNYRDEATRQRTGANVLHHPSPLGDVAADLGLSPEDLRERLDSIRERLLAARAERPRPLLDDKVLTDWNGLMIAALSTAGRTLGTPRFTEAARTCADGLLEVVTTEDGGLLHRVHGGEAAIPGMLDDYAFLAWGLLELYETTFETRVLQEAVRLHRETIRRFEDKEQSGFFLTESGTTDLLARPKSFDDGAIPSGNAVAAYTGLRLGRLLGDPEMEQSGERALAAEAVRLRPDGHAFHLIALSFARAASHEVVIAGEADDAEAEALVEALRSVYAPHAVALRHTPEDDAIRDLVPFVAEQTAVGGQAAAYVCAQRVCQAPVTTPEALRDEIG